MGSGEPSGKKPFELLLVVHESLFELALIKEKFDDGVRCWQGGILEVPQKWANFDAVFICYLPGLGFSTDQIFAAIGTRCSPGNLGTECFFSWVCLISSLSLFFFNQVLRIFCSESVNPKIENLELI